MKYLFTFILLLPSLAHASDMGALLYFLSIPVGGIGLVISILMSFKSRLGVAFPAVIALGLLSYFLGGILLDSYSYEQTGLLHRLQQIVVFGFFAPLLVITIRWFIWGGKENA